MLGGGSRDVRPARLAASFVLVAHVDGGRAAMTLVAASMAVVGGEVGEALVDHDLSEGASVVEELR